MDPRVRRVRVRLGTRLARLPLRALRVFLIAIAGAFGVPQKPYRHVDAIAQIADDEVERE